MVNSMEVNNTKKIMKRYNRIASIYDILEKPMENMAVGKLREEIFKEVSGKVLEVGVGTGKNIEFYPENAEVTAIDFSEKMLNKARRKASILNRNVELLVMDAEDMKFNDNTFDYIITTCVFCSIPDPIKGFSEVKRVLKPSGKMIMIEHVRSEGKILGLVMDLMNPAVVSLMGANINRNTHLNAQKSGFENIKVTKLWKDIVIKIEIQNGK